MQRTPPQTHARRSSRDAIDAEFNQILDERTSKPRAASHPSHYSKTGSERRAVQYKLQSGWSKLKLDFISFRRKLANWAKRKPILAGWLQSVLILALLTSLLILLAIYSPPVGTAMVSVAISAGRTLGFSLAGYSPAAIAAIGAAIIGSAAIAIGSILAGVAKLGKVAIRAEVDRRIEQKVSGRYVLMTEPPRVAAPLSPLEQQERVEQRESRQTFIPKAAPGTAPSSIFYRRFEADEQSQPSEVIERGAATPSERGEVTQPTAEQAHSSPSDPAATSLRKSH